MAQIISSTDLKPADREGISRVLASAEVPLPAPARKLLEELLAAAEAGEHLIAVREGQLLTTTQAAKILGISRPRVSQLIEEGRLRSEKVGAHHRVALADVLERKRRMDALEEMRVIMYTENHPMVWTPEDRAHAPS